MIVDGFLMSSRGVKVILLVLAVMQLVVLPNKNNANTEKKNPLLSSVVD
jgi:hypothetical protein